MAFTDSGGGQTLGQIAQSGTGMQSPQASQGPGLLGRIGAGIWHATKMYQGQQQRKFEQQRVQIEQQRANEQQINSGLDILTTAGKQDDPVIRSILGRRAISQLGIDPKSEDAKTLNEIFKSDKGQQFINDNIDAFHSTHPDVPMSAVPGILKEAVKDGKLFEVFKKDRPEPVRSAISSDLVAPGGGKGVGVINLGTGENIGPIQPAYTAPAAPSVRDQRIAGLVKNNVPENVAEGLVDGRLVYRQDEQGRSSLVDVTTNQNVTGPRDAAAAEVPASTDQVEPSKVAGISKGIDPTEAVGLSGHFARTAGGFMDYVLGTQVSPKSTGAANALRTLGMESQSLLTADPNSRIRGSATALEQWNDLSPLNAKGPNDMAQKFPNAIQFLKDRVSALDEVLQNPSKFSPKDVRDARNFKSRTQQVQREFQAMYNNIDPKYKTEAAPDKKALLNKIFAPSGQ